MKLSQRPGMIDHLDGCPALIPFMRPHPSFATGLLTDGTEVRVCDACGGTGYVRNGRPVRDPRESQRQRAQSQAILEDLGAIVGPGEGSRDDDGPGKPSAPGGGPIVTPEQVEAMRMKLEEAGEPAGAGSIAKALHVSETTVRRKLGRLK